MHLWRAYEGPERFDCLSIGKVARWGQIRPQNALSLPQDPFNYVLHRSKTSAISVSSLRFTLPSAIHFGYGVAYRMSPGAMASSDGARELGGPEVDDEFELGRPLDRKVLRLCALQDLVHLGCRAAIIFNRVGATACANAFYCPFLLVVRVPRCRASCSHVLRLWPRMA